MTTSTTQRKAKAVPAKAKQAKATKAEPAKATKVPRLSGADRAKAAKQSVALRDKKNLSWVKIAEAIGTTPRMANRLYDEVKGKGAHHGLLPGKGGRTASKATIAKEAKLRKAKATK